MKLISISMVKNESDFIERFIRINSNVIDEFFIMDDNSCDETVSILQSLINEGFTITVVSLGTKAARTQYRQNEVMNWLLRYAYNESQEKPDFILPLDADELLFLSREELESKLSQLQPGQYGGMKWTTFVPHAGSLTNKDLLKKRFLPLSKEQYPCFKAIVPAKMIEEQELTMGNHALKNNPYQVDLKIDLCHFPIRSENQIIAKALVTATKFSLKKDKSPSEGYHIIQLANEIRRNKYRLTESQLEQYTLSYLGKQVSKEFKQVPDFLHYEERLPKYTPDSLNLAAVFDNLIVDIIGAN